MRSISIGMMGLGVVGIVVPGMPTTVFLTPDGKIFDKRIGLLPEDQLRSKLQDLLDASSS